MFRQYKIIRSVTRTASLGFFLIGMSGGCSLDRIVSVSKAEIGSEVDHAYLETKAGALGLLNDSRGTLQEAVSDLSFEISTLTDEMAAVPGIGADGRMVEKRGTDIDARVEKVAPNGNRGIELLAYRGLQKTRVSASQARYFLKKLADTSLSYAISASYALEGYAITLLAENLCSGVPLSESFYGSDVFYSPGIPTDSLFKIAVAKFDSALTVAHDSIRYRTLASIGKGRALMSLARYEDAAEAVSGVLIDDVYQIHYAASPPPDGSINSYGFWTSYQLRYTSRAVVNLEGVNGIVWYGNPWTDPRVPVEPDAEAGATPFTILRQTKFVEGSVVINLARWHEAKMIQAEYLLSKSDPHWIEPLNEARRSIGLADTISQPDKSSNVDLLFRERAFWFYGEGVRLSDYRRLVRQYGRAVNSVYPIGPYTYSLSIYGYGDAVVFTPPFSEIDNNYNYSGCINKHP